MAALALKAPLQRAKFGCDAKPTRARAVIRASPVASAAAGEVPDMNKRNLMNLLLLGAIGLPGLPLAGGFAYFFVPPSCAPARVGAAFRAHQPAAQRRALSAALSPARQRAGRARLAAAMPRD
jgi:hypothetical protein